MATWSCRLSRRWALAVLLATTLTATAQHHGDALDDVLQHTPMATVFILKASEEVGLADSCYSRSTWAGLALTAVATYTLSTATAYGLKQVVGELRPDKSDRRSFPSGHATYAFAGATMLHHEYGHVSPWISIGGYGVAALTAVDRVRRDRHYLHDVCVGAAIGIAATELTYYLRKKLIKSKNIDLSFSGQTFDLAVHW